MLFRGLRVHQIFGANTEVGKTVFSTALCRASVEAGEASHYIKPVGTGGYGDDWHVGNFSPSTKTNCLHYFDEPVSPHLAAQRARQKNSSHQIPSDQQVSKGISGIAEKVAKSLRQQDIASLLVETAGGVHSPTLSGKSQSDAYRALRLPTILVASPHLGGISTTISAYESLLLRGYDIDALLCFHESYYENWKYFQRWTEEKGISMGILAPPPDVSNERTDDIEAMKRYYAAIDCEHSPVQSLSIQNLISSLQKIHEKRIADLDSAASRSLDTAWWPFAQHAHLKDPKDIMVIESAYNDMFSVYGEDRASSETGNQNKQMFDGSASWWTQCLGHANPELTLTAAQAAGRYGHVIYATSTHLPALNLTESLLATVGKGWASRVFFSDNGSTGMEVALKMALRSSVLRMLNEGTLPPNRRAEIGVLGLKGSYHGDTIGAMDACEGNVYNQAVDWYRGRGFWFDPPLVQFVDGTVTIRFEGEQLEKTKSFHTPKSYSSIHDVYDVETRIKSDPLTQQYRTHITAQIEAAQQQGIQLGALVLEPIVMGAAGQLFIDPLFQRVLVDIARQGFQLPVVFDEVYVGLYRLGQITGAQLLGVKPDVSCHAKILTGGLLPLAVTLANDKVFQCFLGEQKQDALLHGHSYTAHPIGCAVASKSLELIDVLNKSDKNWNAAKMSWNGTNKPSDHQSNPVFSLWREDFVKQVSEQPNVDSAMTMGTVFVLHLKDTQNAGYQSTASASFLKHLRYPDPESGNIPMHARPLGNTVYWMTALNTAAETVRKLESAILQALQREV